MFFINTKIKIILSVTFISYTNRIFTFLGIILIDKLAARALRLLMALRSMPNKSRFGPHKRYLNGYSFIVA